MYGASAVWSPAWRRSVSRRPEVFQLFQEPTEKPKKYEVQITHSNTVHGYQVYNNSQSKIMKCTSAPQIWGIYINPQKLDYELRQPINVKYRNSHPHNISGTSTTQDNPPKKKLGDDNLGKPHCCLKLPSVHPHLYTSRLKYFSIVCSLPKRSKSKSQQDFDDDWHGFVSKWASP